MSLARDARGSDSSEIVDAAGGVELRPILPSEGSNGGGPRRSKGSARKPRRTVDSDNDTELAVHETRHRTYCGGRCVTGPPEEMCDLQRSFIAVYIFALAAYGGIAGFFMAEFFPALVALPLALIFAGLIGFLLTGCTEPGVVPPQPDRGEVPDAARRWCKKCQMYMLADQRHCSYCDACVRELDHHCGVTGTCVGARNKLHFVMMLYFYMTAFWAIFVGLVYTAVVAIQSRASKFDGTFHDGVTISAHAFSGIMGLMLVGGLVFWVQAYLGHLGSVGKALFRCVACGIVAHGGNLLVTELDREPACGYMTPCPAACTIPERQFYP